MNSYHYDYNPVEKRYIGTDGSWIEKSLKPFNWEIRSPDGELIVQLWFHDAVLRKGVDIPVELYGMIKKYPDKTAIVLRAEDDGADVISGSQLISDIENQELGLFPAKYRLRRIIQ